MKSRKRPAAARMTELSLQEALRGFMEQSPLPFAITRGAEHTLVYANAAFWRLPGLANDEAIGAPVATAFTGTEGRALSAVLDRAFLDGIEQLDERIGASSERASGWQCSVWPGISDNGRPEALGIEIRESTPPDAGLDLQRQVA